MAGAAQPPRILDLSPPAAADAPTRGSVRVVGESVPELQTAFETRPAFASSWITPERFREGDVVSRYAVDGVGVTILSPGESSCGAYLVDPPEYRMNPRQLKVLTEVLGRMKARGPGEAGVPSLSMMRSQIEFRARDMIYSSLAEHDKEMDGNELEKQAGHLANVLCKYTAGFGVLETMLTDPRVQDVYVDAPSSQVPVHVVLRSDAAPGVRQKCRTNVFVGARDLHAFVSRVKYDTGLPFSEAIPVLEADLRRISSRVTLVSPPLSDRGVSVAIRRHSQETWAMPQLIGNGTLSPLLAGFLWACAIGRRAALIAGSRGAGKTTLLTAAMLEFPLSQRILLIEDTPEIPIRRFQSIGYDLQTLRFSSGRMDGNRTRAKEALKVSLRMGESAIVIGEVRGEETRVLYESMRAGSAGSCVLGTIHGNSAKGVLDRAVEDLGVSERAFSSTDIVVVVGLIRSPDGTRFRRRIAEVAEVRSSGNSVELVTLFETDHACQCAKPTEEFSASARSIVGIARALGMKPNDAMEIVKAKAHADQISSKVLPRDCREPHRVSPDVARVRSNEVFTECIFAASTPEAGLKEWVRRNGSGS